METKKRSLFVNALYYGLILGAIFIVISLLVYVFDINMFTITFSIFNLLLNIALVIILFILGANAYRDKSLGGKISYIQCFLTMLIIGVVAYILSLIYTYIFLKYWEPNMLSVYHDKAIEMLVKMGLSEEQMERALSRLEGKFTLSKSILTSVKNGAGMTIILSLLVALFVKKDKTGQEIVM